MGCKLTISVHPSKSPPHASKKGIVQNPVVGIMDDTIEDVDPPPDQELNDPPPDLDDEEENSLYESESSEQEYRLFKGVNLDDDRYKQWRDKFMSAQHTPPPPPPPDEPEDTDETKEWLPHK